MPKRKLRNSQILIQALRSKEGAEGAPAPQKFSVNVPFFFDEPFRCALFERSNQRSIYMKMNTKNHEQFKIKHNTLKRSSFFV